jgi:hypothetical protein
MRKREQLLWDTFKRHGGAALNLQRVENVVMAGMPDVYVGCSGKWVELKAPSTIPKRPQTPLLGSEGLRTAQINWHLKHSFNGHAPASYILVRTVELELILLPGVAAAIINELPLEALRTHRCVLSDWKEVIEELK